MKANDTAAKRHRRAAALCKKHGHVITSRTYAGPDGGADHFDCTRCGMSDTVIYY